MRNVGLISSEYIGREEILKEEFLKNKPFCHLSLNNFLEEEKAIEILSSLKKIDYYLEDHDLYQFLRTVDFKNIREKNIQKIRSEIFSDEFVSFMEKVTGTKLIMGKGDLHSLKLRDTHYLLCHDDEVQNRKIAFIINLSQNWDEKDGGALEFFEMDSKGNPSKVSKSIVPEFNQMNFFKIGVKSFHQISEVTSDKERISLSGWFYEN